MNRPGFLTMALGHPLIAYPMLGFTLVVGYATFVDTSIWPVTAVSVFVLYRVADASLARLDFLDWKAAWDGMSGRSRQKASARDWSWQKWLSWTATAITLFALWGNSGDPQIRFAFDYLMICLAAGGLAKWWLRRRNIKAAKAATRTQPVSVCVKGPLVSVPRLKQAYRAVPAYCQTLLQAA